MAGGWLGKESKDCLRALRLVCVYIMTCVKSDDDRHMGAAILVRAWTKDCLNQRISSLVSIPEKLWRKEVSSTSIKITAT
jgi:hypothetical protein